jgi:hypothetical protein
MRFGLLGLLLLAAVGHAAEHEPSVRFVPPPGFQGHKWGEVRAAFHRLPSAPISVGAAWMRIQEKQLGYTCQLNTWLPKYQTQWVDNCKPSTLLHGKSEFKAGGTYVLSEYAIDDQGFRLGDATTGVVLHPVIYQFCANWRGKRDKRTPPNFDDLNRFCGMKFMFKTEIGEELRKLKGAQVTAYDRVLQTLIELYGRPKGFSRRAKVFIDTAEDEQIDAEIRRFNTWRWCPAVDEGLHTDCTASVTLSLDPVTGMATVLYSTPLLWEFAFARQNFGFQGDPLFKALHALD